MNHTVRVLKMKLPLLQKKVFPFHFRPFYKYSPISAFDWFENFLCKLLKSSYSLSHYCGKKLLRALKTKNCMKLMLLKFFHFSDDVLVKSKHGVKKLRHGAHDC